jgi:malonyl-CoA O-methyltransferase
VGCSGNGRALVMKPTHPGLDRIRQAFSAAEAYDEHARVQRATAERLAEVVASLALPDRPAICEIGCGTGFLSEALRRSVPEGRFLATDISEQMLLRARRRLGDDSRFEWAIVDGERPDDLAAKAPFDVICSSLAAQWFSDLGGALSRLTAFLRPGGTLLVGTLAEGTFAEWRRAHAACGLQPGTPDYLNASELLALAPAGTAAEVQMSTFVDRVGSGHAFLRSLRAIGAHTPSPEHRALNAGQMRRVLRAFGSSPQVTYEIATCRFRREAAQ